MQEDTIKALQEIYKNKLPTKILNIQSQWRSLQQEWNTKNLDALFKSIHMLHGSAGSYGFPEISLATHDLEIYLKELMKIKSTVSLNQIKNIETMLHHIHTVIEHILSTPNNNKIK